MSRQPKVWNRKLNWLSSVDGDPKLLAELDRSMAAFYSEFPRRQKYQAVIDADSSAQPQTEGAMRTAILARQPATVLEVGCGSARIYQRLRAEGLQGAYTGLEMSPELIAQDQKAFPGASWLCGSIYDAPLPPGTFDAVYAYFVLEHCVYPERAVERMVSLLRPDGAVTLVFPDCVEMGRVGSQALGFVPGRASERLQRGDVFNAFFNLYESRIRLPRALKHVVEDYGPFPVNLGPRCLSDPEFSLSRMSIRFTSLPSRKSTNGPKRRDCGWSFLLAWMVTFARTRWSSLSCRESDRLLNKGFPG